MDWTLLGAVGATGSGFVLLNAGWWKLRHRPAFALVLGEQGRFVAAHAASLAWVLPVIELVLGLGALGFVLPPSARADLALPTWLPMVGTTLLGAAFACYAAAQLARGPQRPRCGCLDSDDRFGPHTVLRALALVVGGLGGWLTAGGGADVLPPALWAAAVVVGGLMVTVVLLVGLPLITSSVPSAYGDRDRPGGQQLADHRRAGHLTGDQEPP